MSSSLLSKKIKRSFKSLIDNLSLQELKELNYLVNLDDEVLKNIKNNILSDNIPLTSLVKNFQSFKI